MAALVCAAPLLLASEAGATVQLLAKSYDMRNGTSGGSYPYLDEIYAGPGASGDPLAFFSELAGGAGDLTDAVIAAQNWGVTEPPAGNGPYVGWVNFNPTITFHFDGPPTITEIIFYFDDNNGGGGVSTPASVVIDGGTAVPIIDPPGAEPLAVSVSGLSITKSSFDVVINRRTEWIMLSEVQFFGEATQTPGPAPLALLVGALAGIAGLARRR